MAMNTDNNEDDRTLQEVYGRFRVSRRGVTGSGESAVQFAESRIDASQDGKSEDAESQVEQLYSQYQQNRISGADAAVDAIVNSIVADTREVTVEKTTPVTEASQSGLSRLFRLPGNLLDRLLGSGQSTRYAIPAFAAAVFGLLLVPFYFSGGQGDSEMVAHAEPLSEYISPASATELGFGNTGSQEKAAFVQGVYLADLEITARTNKLNRIEAQAKLLQSTTTHQEAIGEMLDGGLAVASRNGISKEQIDSQLMKIRESLGTATAQMKTDDWFLMGRAIELVRVSAAYAKDSGEIKPLEESLKILNSLPQPGTEGAASSIISELKGMSTETLDPPVIRKILALSENSILVMR